MDELKTVFIELVPMGKDQVGYISTVSEPKCD